MNDVLTDQRREITAHRPGAAATGSVAPMRLRIPATACSPLTCMATSGPEVMNVTSSPKKGRSVCSA
jgi:hypothetical protein